MNISGPSFFDPSSLWNHYLTTCVKGIHNFERKTIFDLTKNFTASPKFQEVLQRTLLFWHNPEKNQLLGNRITPPTKSDLETSLNALHILYLISSNMQKMIDELPGNDPKRDP